MEEKERKLDNLTNEEKLLINEENLEPKEIDNNGTGSLNILHETMEEMDLFWSKVDRKLEDIVDEYKDEIIEILEKEGKI